jgi:hypothetical protein
MQQAWNEGSSGGGPEERISGEGDFNLSQGVWERCQR